jgi:hypothetical protein
MAGPLEPCEICNHTGQTAHGVACPVCRGTGMAPPLAAETHRQLLRQAALAGAVRRAERLGAAGVEAEARTAAQARQDAAQYQAATEQAARRADDALSRVAAAVKADTAARAADAIQRTADIAAMAALMSPGPPLPPIPPGAGPTDPGTPDPLFTVDTAQIRDLFVWGALHVQGSGGLMTNPMTTQGDLITGASGGTPQRLPVDTNGQLLSVVAGAVAWATVAVLTNPMTAPGDLITGNTGGVPQRLGVGAAGQVLTVVSGQPVWQNSAAGFANPMSTFGDLITGGVAGAATRLGIGTAGQVLTTSGGVPVWANSPSGFANPMTTTGDTIYSSPGATPRRLAVGTLYQRLGAVAGVPAWITPAYIVVPPSGDVTGATDAAAINAAFTALNAVAGGTVILLPGDYYINNTITGPQQRGSSPTSGNYPCSLIGSRGATVIHALATPAIYMHRNVQYGGGGPQNGQPNPMAPMGQLRDFTLTGASAGSNSVGIDCGDGWGGAILDVCVKDYYSAGANCIGIYLINRVGWSEKWTIRAHTINNDQHVVVDTLNPSNAGDCSSEYNVFDLFMYMLGGSNTISNAGQIGIQWWNGTFLGGGKINIRGNHGGGGSGNNGTVLQVGGGASDGTSGNWSQIYNTEMYVTVEGNGTSNLPHLIRLNDPSGNNSLAGSGMLVAQYAGWSNSVLNGGNFKFSGRITGDSVLQTGWPSTTFPGVGTAWVNNGPDALVCVSGGSGITGINIGIGGGVNYPTGLTAGAFFVKAGDSLIVNGGTPANFSIVPAN